MYTKFSGELPRGCLPKNGFWYILLIGKQLPWGTFYQRPYSSIIHLYDTRIGSLVKGTPFAGQLPWKFGGGGSIPSGTTLGVFTQKSGFCTKNRIWHIFTHWLAAPHRLVVLEWGLCQRVSPPPGQLPWKFGRDEPFPSRATLGVFAQKMGFDTKNGIWHILLTGRQLPTGA